MSSAPTPQKEAPAPPRLSSRTRRITAHVCVALGSLIAVVALLGGYLRYQIFDSSTFRSTAQDLIGDDAIRNALAAGLVDRLFANVNLTAVLEKRLPEQQKGFAAPLAAAVASAADAAAPRLLARPRVQELFVETASRSRDTLERVIENDTRGIKTQGGYVVLDLKPLLDRLAERVPVVSKAQERGAPTQVRIVKADQFATAQKLTNTVRKVATWVWIVPFLLWGLAIWLARGRRRRELRAVSLGMIAAGLLVLAVRAIGGRYVTNHLAKTDAVKPAAHNAWQILTQLLADGAWSLILVGVVALVGAWLAGDTRSGRAVRHALAPAIVRPAYAYGFGLVFLLALAWWGPTAQTRRLWWLLVAAILLAVGIETLRRFVAREEPDARTRPVGPAMAALWRRPVVAGVENERLDDLERLARLKESGVLSDAEVAAEKARVLQASEGA